MPSRVASANRASPRRRRAACSIRATSGWEQSGSPRTAVLAASIVPAVAGGYLLSGRALRPIKTAMESQRIFIADASHELRTPVAVVRTNAELLKRHFEPDTAQTAGSDQVALDDILSESDRLGRMVDQMLTLAEADAGQRTVLTAEVSLNELVDQVTRSMRSLAEAREISLNAQLNSDISLSGDPSRLRELLTVLLDNAVKYTDAGGRVDVSVRKEHRKAIITVSDNGPGIPSEALPHVFDRFYRVDEARSRESGGTGLGLAIARHIVEAHSGTIDVESKIREGTVVTVELPA